jgi:hypothetical protein
MPRVMATTKLCEKLLYSPFQEQQDDHLVYSSRVHGTVACNEMVAPIETTEPPSHKLGKRKGINVSISATVIPSV